MAHHPVNARSIKHLLMLPMLALLLTACAGQPTTLPLDSQLVKAAAIPALSHKQGSYPRRNGT